MSSQPVFGAVDQSDAPDATHFRVGDVWETRAGYLHKVMSVTRKSVSYGSVKFATLRAGSNGAGRKSERAWDATSSGYGRIWVRVYWGGQP